MAASGNTPWNGRSFKCNIPGHANANCPATARLMPVMPPNSGDTTYAPKDAPWCVQYSTCEHKEPSGPTQSPVDTAADGNVQYLGKYAEASHAVKAEVERLIQENPNKGAGWVLGRMITKHGEKDSPVYNHLMPTLAHVRAR